MSIRTQYMRVRLKGRAKSDKKHTDAPLVAVANDVLFAFAQATILPAATGELLKVAAKLKQYPGVRFRVEGHASVEGSDVFNQDLSERRARAVKSWLTTTGGLDAGRFDAKGLGEKKPIAPSSNPDGSANQPNRRKNRRVEVRQIRPDTDKDKRQETGKEYNVDITPYLTGSTTLDDEDGLIQTLNFTLVDSALWTNALTIGMGVELVGGLDEATSTSQFTGNVKRIVPTFTETGEVQLAVTAYGKEWFATAREPRDLIYPSDNHPKSWARADKLTVSTIVKNLAQDAKLKIGEIDVHRDVTYTRTNPLRQHKQTDWSFLQELMNTVHATAYLSMVNGENKLFVKDNTRLLKTTGSVTFYWPLREGGVFKFSTAGANQIQFESADVTLDPDLSDTGVGGVSVKVDPVTGEQKIVKEEYNKDTKGWEDWVLDEQALRRLPEAVRDELIDAFLAGNQTWEDVKMYFRRASVQSQSSRVPEDSWRSVLYPTGVLPDTGVGSTATVPLKGPLTNNAVNWRYDEKLLAKATPEERSRVFGLIARNLLTFDNAVQFDALQYYHYVPTNAAPKEQVAKQPETKVPTVADDKKKKKKRTTKRDAGFKIEAEFYGNEAVDTRTSYVIEGLSMYSGVYYLYRLQKSWGDGGFMMNATFVR